MSIQEAIKTGRPFRRAIWSESLGYVVIDEYRIFAWESLKKSNGQLRDLVLTPKDILSEDWEVKP